MHQLTSQQLDQISQAISDAEKRTSGEIISMLVNQSDDYPGARWRLAIISALIFGFITHAFVEPNDSIWILWSQLPGLYFGYWLSSFRPFRHFFLHASKVNEEVHQRALQAFFAHNLHTTKNRNAILIMVSLFEQRVEILADSGINEIVSENTWKNITNNMLNSIKTKDLSQGFCTAIHECADVLAVEFPASDQDNPNEVSNKLIIED